MGIDRPNTGHHLRSEQGTPQGLSGPQGRFPTGGRLDRTGPSGSIELERCRKAVLANRSGRAFARRRIKRSLARSRHGSGRTLAVALEPLRSHPFRQAPTFIQGLAVRPARRPRIHSSARPFIWSALLNQSLVRPYRLRFRIVRRIAGHSQGGLGLLQWRRLRQGPIRLEVGFGIHPSGLGSQAQPGSGCRPARAVGRSRRLLGLCVRPEHRVARAELEP